ncbi:membrane lipoprotein lipid attachment site-containing protein [Solibacillus sp. MA9]|uniref:Membrane lipoprotein lipid attachment site-containing protein n=1 Tax=Solibacillus palustris TaxID=2908203 RepID=A0ABS9UG19_9BACL|nr:membrane lipoprotein lipid attachment site-containing protein [Solibacillus sp. MA9]MCH7323306.1 membrane lipoprotein lipid attachment site-containing protein [Solibacillus sp. MA9]
MKKIVFVLLIVFLLTSCGTPKVQTFETYFNESGMVEIEKLVIQDGSTGYSKTTTDSQQIEQLLNLIKPIQVIPEKNQEDRTGWRYMITLFQDEKLYSFTLNKIEEIYYHTKQDIHPIVDEYYKALDIEGK